jgi:hypothetical protein
MTALLPRRAMRSSDAAIVLRLSAGAATTVQGKACLFCTITNWVWGEPIPQEQESPNNRHSPPWNVGTGTMQAQGEREQCATSQSS